MVNFMIIGAMKCGTTTLSEILRRHPEIEFCERELQFFSKTPDWRKHRSDYERNFKFEKGKVVGEASTTYTFYPEFNLEIWKDIYEYNPEMKFIYVVRDPVERAVSQYMHMYERGYTNYTLEEAIVKIPMIINNGRYYTQIKPYIDQFGMDKILIVDFEDIKHKERELLARIAAFLKVDATKFEDISDVHANVSIDGGKWHYKYDKFKSRINWMRTFLPRPFRNLLWDFVTGRRSRAFKIKPKVAIEFQNVILNILRLEIIELNKLTDGKYLRWLNR